jgi:hypothetical protein
LRANILLDRRAVTMTGVEDREFEFMSSINSIGGISKGGLEKLEKAAVVNITAVLCLDAEDIVELKLAVGERGIFKVGWQALVAQKAIVDRSSTPIPTPTPVSSEEQDPEVKVYSLNNITKFLGQTQGQAVLSAQTSQTSTDGKLEALEAAASIKASSLGQKPIRRPEPVTAK